MPGSTPWQWLLPCVLPLSSVVDVDVTVLIFGLRLRLNPACHQLALVRYDSISFNCHDPDFLSNLSTLAFR
jgi:hypothetical protein